MKIWKYELEVTDEQFINVPAGAKILSVQMQVGTLQLWALVDETLLRVPRKIWIIGTGNPTPSQIGLATFIDTFQLHGGALVFHVFEA